MHSIITTTLSYYKMLDIKPNFSELARIYNLDRRTIKKHYEAGGQKLRKKRNYTSYLDSFKEIIEEKLNTEGITYIGIYKFLVNEKGLKGTYSNFKAYLRKRGYKKNNSTTVHLRYETKPGKQLQFDWKENIRLITNHGEIITFHLFSAILSSSRLHYFTYSESLTKESFKRCFIESLYFFGGLTEEALTDNMSAIVSYKGVKKYKYPDIIQFEKEIGISIRLCKKSSPETKGKVESQNRFVSRLLAYNNEFETKEELIEIIKKLNKNINEETSSSIGVAPIILYKNEKEYLLPLPSKSLLDTHMIDSITKIVPQTLLVDFEGNKYSVPMKYINKRVKLIKVENILHIYFNTELICIHEISSKKINYLQEHYEEGLRTRIKSENIDIKELAKENLKLFDTGGYNE